MSSGIYRKRVEALEERVRPERQPERSTAVREHMRAHLDRLAAFRRGELSEEEAAEVMSTHAAIESRMREIQGEGAS